MTIKEQPFATFAKTGQEEEGTRKHIVIPFYQRSYVWGEKEDTLENCTTLIDDIVDATQNKTTHFIGTIITKENENEKDYITLIDGQQRVTTIFLILKALSCLIKGENKTEEIYRLTHIGDIKEANKNFVMQHNMYDKDTFHSIMNEAYDFYQNDSKENKVKFNSDNNAEIFNYIISNGKAGKLGEKISEHNIFKAYSKIILYINELNNNNNDETGDFLRSLYDKVKAIKLVNIILNPEDNEQQIFDRTNSMGVELTVDELLKNYLFSEDDISNYKENWEDVFEKNKIAKDYWKTNFSGDKNKYNLALMLSSAIYIIRKEFGLENNLVKDTELLKEYKNTVKEYLEIQRKKSDNTITEKDVKQLVIQKIKEISTTYQENFIDSINKIKIEKNDYLKRLFFLIYNSKLAIFLPYILFVIKFGKEENKNKIYQTLEAYIISHIMVGEQSAGLNKVIYDKLIKSEITEVINIQTQLYDEKDVVRKFYNKLNDTLEKASDITFQITSTRLRAILYIIEIISRSDVAGTDMKPFNKYSLEHIIPNSVPKNNKENWESFRKECEQNKDTMEKYVNQTIGNFILLIANANSKLSDKDKKYKFDKYNSEIGKGLLIVDNAIKLFDKNNEQWGVDQVIEQQKWLAGKILEIWDRKEIWGK